MTYTLHSDDPVGCADTQGFPEQITDDWQVEHDPGTGNVTVTTSQGEFQGTLDQQDCSASSGCTDDENAPMCTYGCTITNDVCFIEDDPARIVGTSTIDVHNPDGGLCQGPVACTVVYDVHGVRQSPEENPTGASGNSRSMPIELRGLSAAWKALGEILTGAMTALEKLLSGG
jgi:hypothetical protein